MVMILFMMLLLTCTCQCIVADHLEHHTDVYMSTNVGFWSHVCTECYNVIKKLIHEL